MRLGCEYAQLLGALATLTACTVMIVRFDAPLAAIVIALVALLALFGI